MEVHTILAPVVPVLHKFKLLLEERVIWMDYRKRFVDTVLTQTI